MINNLLADDDVKEVIIKKNNIQSDVCDGSVRNLYVNLSIQIVYNDLQTQIEATTVSEYMNYWLYEIKKRKLKPTSFDRQEITVQHMVLPILGDIELNKLSTSDIQRMIDKLKEQNYSYSSVKKAFEAVRSCLKFAAFENKIIKNPADFVELFHNEFENKENIKFWNDDEVEVFKKEAISRKPSGEYVYRLGNAFILLLSTGMRVGEALALKWADIDIDGKIIFINKNVARIKNRAEHDEKKYVMVEQSTKTKNGNRVIPLNDAAINALSELYKITGKCSTVLADRKGEYIVYRNFDKTFKTILRNCNLTKTGIHTLRHTFASKLFRSGVDLKTISEILGHSDTSITSDIYVHIIQEQKMRAVSVIDTV